MRFRRPGRASRVNPEFRTRPDGWMIAVMGHLLGWDACLLAGRCEMPRLLRARHLLGLFLDTLFGERRGREAQTESAITSRLKRREDGRMRGVRRAGSRHIKYIGEEASTAQRCRRPTAAVFQQAVNRLFRNLNG